MQQRDTRAASERAAIAIAGAASALPHRGRRPA